MRYNMHASSPIFQEQCESIACMLTCFTELITVRSCERMKSDSQVCDAGWTFDSHFMATAYPGLGDITPQSFSNAPQLSQPCLEKDRLCDVADSFRERITGLEAALAALQSPVVAPAPAPEGLVINPANPPMIAPGGNSDKAPATAPSGLEAPAPG